MDLSDKSQLLKYLKQHGLWAKKSFSQNFLADKDSLNKIVEAAKLKSDDFVVEIGPGLGVLTAELVQKAGEVAAVELDNNLSGLLGSYISSKFETLNSKQIQNLKEKNSKQVSDLEFENLNIVSDLDIRISDLDHNLKIINDDVLRINLDNLTKDRPYKVVANIPYAITSKILRVFLEREHKPELMVLLVQKEVAERVVAKVGDYSKLAISVQVYGDPEIVDIVPKESFFPSPKVDSAILRIRVAHPKGVGAFHPWGDSGLSEKEFFRCVNIGFASRRKTLANNLSAGYQLEKEKAVDIIKKVGLRQDIRAQDLSIDDWRRLCLQILNPKS